MDAVAAPSGVTLEPGHTSLSALSPGSSGVVVSVGSSSRELTPLDRRLLEFGFCSGERVEILAEARPGRDPFVVRVGNTTLALRRFEAENIWVDTSAQIAGPRPPYRSSDASERVDTSAQIAGPRPPYRSSDASERVDTSTQPRQAGGDR
jgi:ferrous iron transport protein A